MNKATVLFASTTVLLAALSFYLARALHEERARSRDAPVAQQPSASTTQVESQGSRAQTVDAQPAQVQTAPARKEETRPPNKTNYRDRLTHRTYRESQLAEMRLRLEQQFPDLAAAMNLQPDEAGRFFDLLAQQQLSDAEFENGYFKQGGRDPRNRQKEMADRGQEHRAEQAALLGDAKMAEWTQYVNSLGARAQVRELRMLLADSDYPLRAYQYEPMVAALAAEQQRHNAERQQLRGTQPDQGDVPPEQVIEYMGKRLDLIEASLARRRRVAQLHLDSEQLRRYDSMLELEHRRAQIDYDAFVTLNAEVAAGTRPRAAQ